MIKTIYCCDWCKKEVTEPIMLTKNGAPYKDMCICEACLPHCKPATEKATILQKTRKIKKKNAVKEQEAPRKKLDVGKMQALRNAGWSFEDIADELHTTPGTVKNYLSTMKRKEGA